MGVVRLIDILNLIAKGELEEGAEMRIGCVSFFYRNGILENGKGYPLFTSSYLSKSALLQEVEIIGNDTNVATKIEEIHYTVEMLEKPSYNESWLMNCVRANRDKLNEVIRVLNRRSE